MPDSSPAIAKPGPDLLGPEVGERVPFRSFRGSAAWSSGDSVKYQARFQGAFKGLVAGSFRHGRKYLDALWGLEK